MKFGTLVNSRIRSAFAAVALAALVGCGESGPPRYEMHGVVQYDGKPVPIGSMTLIPDATTARTTVAKIVDGKYSAELTEGMWTVNIQAVRETGPIIPSLGEAPREQYIPPKYNRESTIKVNSPPDPPEQNFQLEK